MKQPLAVVIARPCSPPTRPRRSREEESEIASDVCSDTLSDGVDCAELGWWLPGQVGTAASLLLQPPPAAPPRVEGVDVDWEFDSTEDVTWLRVGEGRVAVSPRPKVKRLAVDKRLGATAVVSLLRLQEGVDELSRAAADCGLQWYAPLSHLKRESAAERPNAIRACIAALRKALKAGNSVTMHCANGSAMCLPVLYGCLRCVADASRACARSAFVRLGRGELTDADAELVDREIDAGGYTPDSRVSEILSALRCSVEARGRCPACDLPRRGIHIKVEEAGPESDANFEAGDAVQHAESNDKGTVIDTHPPKRRAQVLWEHGGQEWLSWSVLLLLDRPRPRSRHTGCRKRGLGGVCDPLPDPEVLQRGSGGWRERAEELLLAPPGDVVWARAHRAAEMLVATASSILHTVDSQCAALTGERTPTESLDNWGNLRQAAEARGLHLFWAERAVGDGQCPRQFAVSCRAYRRAVPAAGALDPERGQSFEHDCEGLRGGPQRRMREAAQLCAYWAWALLAHEGDDEAPPPQPAAAAAAALALCAAATAEVQPEPWPATEGSLALACERERADRIVDFRKALTDVSGLDGAVHWFSTVNWRAPRRKADNRERMAEADKRVKGSQRWRAEMGDLKMCVGDSADRDMVLCCQTCSTLAVMHPLGSERDNHDKRCRGVEAAAHASAPPVLLFRDRPPADGTSFAYGNKRGQRVLRPYSAHSRVLSPPSALAVVPAGAPPLTGATAAEALAELLAVCARTDATVAARCSSLDGQVGVHLRVRCPYTVTEARPRGPGSGNASLLVQHKHVAVEVAARGELAEEAWRDAAARALLVLKWTL